MKTMNLILIAFILILTTSTVSGQSNLCNLPSDTPKPESCNTGLNYNLIDTEISDETVDQDIFIPRVNVNTNAEKIYLEIGSRDERLFNDGNHEDYSSTDNWYGNSIDISDTLGNKQLALRFEKGSETKKTNVQQTDFKMTPPSPEIEAKFNDGGLLVEVTDTNYPRETTVELNVSVKNDENTKRDVDISLDCESDCLRQVSFNSEAGDEAEVGASQRYEGLNSGKITNNFVYSGEPSINVINYSRGVEESIVEKVAVDSYWMAGTVGISAVNFNEEDIQEFNYTYNGQKLGEWSEDTGLGGLVSLYQELDTYTGNNIFIGNFNFSGSKISGGTDTEVPITFNLKLDSGKTISEDLTTVETVEDSEEPFLVDDPTVWHINSSSVDINLDLKDNLQNHVNCEAYTSDEDEFIGDCSTNLRSPGGESFGDLETDMPGNLDNIIKLDLELSDGSGNSRTETIGPFLIDPENTLKPVEKNGDPREKINLVTIGHEMSVTETENALEERINWFFTQNDLDVHGRYRDFFNWYILDTEKDVCGEVSGYNEEDTDECDVLDSLESVEQSDELKGGRTAYIVMSSESDRSYAWGDKTYIFDQYVGGDDNVFAHELGHLIWGFDDEYGQDNEIYGAFQTTFFESSDGENLNPENHSNTFIQEESCESNMTVYYSKLDPSDCWYQDDASNGKGYIIKNSQKGKSLMFYNDPTYYQTHEKRIKYLVENSPIYQGVIN